MKTAVSIPDRLFRAAEAHARRTGLPRSRLYAVALEEYLARTADDEITARLNASFAANPQEPDPFMREAARRTLLRCPW